MISKNLSIIIIVSALVFIMFGYYFIVQEPVPINEVQSTQTQTPKINTTIPTESLVTLPSKNIKYELERLSNDFSSPQYFDARLIAINNVGQKEILVQSIKTAIPELQKDFNRTLTILSISTDNTKIFLQEILDATDAPISAIFSFDVNSRKFTKLLLSTSDLRYFIELSPDKQLFAGVSADDKQVVIFIFDFLLNEKIHAVVMPSTETIFAGRGLDGGEYLKWIDERTVEYTVYDKTVFNDGYKYIGTRRLALP